jgi:putative ABC transport system permease protein
MVDSFVSTINRGAAEIEGDTPDRLTIQLDAPYPLNAPNVEAVTASPLLARVEPALQLGGTVLHNGVELQVTIQMQEFEGGMWAPTVTEGEFDASTPGILIAEKAAQDLDIGPGSFVTLRHPVLMGEGTFALVDTGLPVLGVHPHPFRFVTYMDIRHAGIFGLADTANTLYALPSEGAEINEVKRELFNVPGVVSTEPVTILADVFRDLMEQVLGLLQIVEGVVLLLALMIAFNTSSISMDERAREHATMFAFGISPRRVLGIAITESAVIGIIATLLGLLGGYALLRYVLDFTASDVSPDIQILPVLSPSTVGVALALGVLAVAAAPLLNFRRLRRMNIPSTLRVME